jgi:3-oxoacid CoA-transferase
MWSKFLSRGFSSKVYNSAKEAVSDITSGSTIAVGGFGNSGIPENLINAASDLALKDLTLVSNNCGTEGYGLHIMLLRKQVKKVIASYVGENEIFERGYLNGEIELEITPQGNLAERLRAGGAGIPAFFTAAGYGTVVSEGNFPIKFKLGGKEPEILSTPKETRNIDGRDYVLQNAIKTDYALVKAWKGDKLGNLIYKGSSQNFNPLAAMAGKITIAEVEHLVEPGELDPAQIHTPSVYVQRIIKGETYLKPIERLTLNTGQDIQIPGKGEVKLMRERIIKRAAKEIKSGMYVNLGIGMPTLVPNYLKPHMDVYLQSENGILGMGPYPTPGNQDPDLINAGKETVTLIKGAALFNSAESFAMIRGGNLQLSILGGLQVSKDGDLANWIVPGKMVKGMGGAMDLVSSPARCVVTMEHTNKNVLKILNKCTLPLTGKKVVNLLITELGVFDFTREGGITLIEIGKGVTVDQIKINTECDFLVASDLKEMMVE